MQALVQAPQMQNPNQSLQAYISMLTSAAAEYANVSKVRSIRVSRGGGRRGSSSPSLRQRKATREAKHRKEHVEDREYNLRRLKVNTARTIASERHDIDKAERNQAIALRKRRADIEDAPTKTEAEQMSRDAENKASNVKRMQEGMSHAGTFLEQVTPDTYDDWVNWVGEEKWAPAEVFESPDRVMQMAPEEFQAYKTSLSEQLQGKTMRGSRGGMGYAPDIMERRNPETGKTIRIDERDPREVAQAEQQGYSPVDRRTASFLKGEGKIAADAFGTITSDAKKARQSIATLKTMEGLLDRFESGKLASATKTLQQWGNSFGIPVDTVNLSAKESFLAFANQLALQSRNLGEGMVLAGQMSDQDVKFLKDMNPQLVISKGGNKMIIKIRKALAERRSKVAEDAAEYKKQNRGYFDPLEFENYTREKYTDKNIFGIPNSAKLVGQNKKTGLPIYEFEGKYITPNL